MILTLSSDRSDTVEVDSVVLATVIANGAIVNFDTSFPNVIEAAADDSKTVAV